MGNKLTRMAREILDIESDLPFRFDYSKGEKPTIDDFQMVCFEQVWGSTSLGFGGIGGQAMTAANTYVFVPVTADQKCFVYFAGKFAYSADWQSDAFKKDVKNGCVEPVHRASKYHV